MKKIKGSTEREIVNEIFGKDLVKEASKINDTMERLFDRRREVFVTALEKLREYTKNLTGLDSEYWEVDCQDAQWLFDFAISGSIKIQEGEKMGVYNHIKSVVEDASPFNIEVMTDLWRF